MMREAFGFIIILAFIVAIGGAVAWCSQAQCYKPGNELWDRTNPVWCR